MERMPNLPPELLPPGEVEAVTSDYKILASLRNAQQKLDKILNRLQTLTTKEEVMAQTQEEAFASLTAEISATGAVDTEVATELNTLATLLKEQATAPSAEKLAEAATSLTTLTVKLKEAAGAAAPPPPPPPPPPPA
jgi:hypothetical protein